MPLQEGTSDEVVGANTEKVTGSILVNQENQRFDSATLLQPLRSPAGYLRVPARLTRVGVFSYQNPDGSVTKEFRPPEEVFNAASLDSLRLAPVTRGHPNDGKGVYPARARALARGAVGELVKADGDFVQATLGIYDADLIEAIERGDEREVSCGYVREWDPTPGEWNGEKYDGVQRNIRYNHVAVVVKGRAGPEVSLRMDQDDEAKAGKAPEAQKGDSMAKITVGGKEHECSQELADAFAAEQAAAQKQDSAQAFEREKARADAAEAQVKQLQDEKSKLPELVRARVALERQAAEFVGAEKADGLTDRQLKEAVIAKALPEMKLDGASDAYVDGAFEAAIKAKPAAKVNAVRGVGIVQRSDGEKSPYQRMVEEQRNAWKQTKESK